MPNYESYNREKESTAQGRRSQSESTSESSAQLHPLLKLQRQIGNAQIARMLAQRQPSPTEDDEEPMMMQGKHDPSLAQRAPEVGLEGGEVSAETANRIQSKMASGGGSPLSGDLAQRVESHFGVDPSAIRIHNDSESHELNRLVSAEQFSIGTHIFQGPNARDSNLPHEVGHTIQYLSGELNTSGPMSVTAANHPNEADADAKASMLQSSAPAAGIQREAEENAGIQRMTSAEEDLEEGAE
ncbi:MAG: hypothetical protein KatS3mg057_2099 [Herpetosiphonaceae bacterium]|nr:MAG: hypothetical protein KatS3mg057_2099 [Herpetosiphonaceae bacterium]